jgi:hypothetical protein
MEKYFFWSFSANLLFIFGISGYLFMDILDYKHSNLFQLFSINLIYILLAIIFVINSILQFFVIYYINKHTQRYYTMILSSIFDTIASHAYLLGAIFTLIASTKINLISTLNTLGVCGFVIGASINLMIPEMNWMSICADYLNLLGSLFYLLAIIVTQTQIIVIVGDVIYLIDSCLYMICWFQERQGIIRQKGQYFLFK